MPDEGQHRQSNRFRERYFVNSRQGIDEEAQRENKMTMSPILDKVVEEEDVGLEGEDAMTVSPS